jgi:xylulose-5-phosphate/fructose-6-phosphate phosphoketolase
MAPAAEVNGVAVESISAYGTARSTVSDKPLNSEEVRKIEAYFRASMYLCLGMIHLRENPLLKEPLKKEQLKARLLGHWGSDAGQAFTWMHFNRLIKKYDLDALFVSGPGHGAPAILSQAYLEGTYSEVYPDMSENEEGMKSFFRQFSFPGGIGSHATPGQQFPLSLAPEPAPRACLKNILPFSENLPY